MPKAKLLSDPKIQELSLIFGSHKGEEWAPRNPGATVLGLKGAAVDENTHAQLPTPTFLDRLVAAFKGRSDKGWLVKDDTPDNVDGDGDGATDYEQLASLISGASYDLQSATCISDPDARSVAITTALDNFKKNLDDVYSGGDGTAAWKAGARHSKADAGHIAAIGDATKKIADHAKAMVDLVTAQQDHVDALSSTPPDKKDANGQDDPDEGGSDDPSDDKAKAKAVTPDASDYADPGYQEDGKKRYPLDTAEHVKAAASYFGMEKNRSKYTAEQQKAIDAKIAAAKKKFDIGDDADKGGAIPGNPLPPMAAITPEAIAAAFAPTLKAALDEQAASLKGEFASALTTTTDALKADFDSRLAAIETATTEKAAAKDDEIDTLKASVNAIVGAARATRTARGGFAAIEPDGTTRKSAALADGTNQLPVISPTDPATGPQGAIRRLLAAQTG